MLRILVDTCVWLDLAKDYRQQALILAARELFNARQIDFIVPDVVKDEFARHKERVAQDAQRSLLAHFRLVREAVDRFAEEDYKKETLKSLNEVDQRIAMKGEAVNDSIEWVEGLLSAGVSRHTTKGIKQRVAERALAGLAPYHRSKNSVGDAILVETYADMAKAANAKGGRVAFVTHNVRDFGDPTGDQRSPHPDLAPIFDGPHSTYWTSLGDLLRAEHAEWLDDTDAEFNWTEEPRRLSQILAAARLLETPGLVQQALGPPHPDRARGHAGGHEEGVGRGRAAQAPDRGHRRQHLEGRARGSAEDRGGTRGGEPRAVVGLRVGHDQRQAVRPALGDGRRLGHARHVRGRRMRHWGIETWTTGSWSC